MKRQSRELENRPDDDGIKDRTNHPIADAFGTGCQPMEKTAVTAE